MYTKLELIHIGHFISLSRRGRSQSEISRKSGVSQQQISKIEFGANCTVETLLKILDALDINVTLPIRLDSPKVQGLNKKVCENPFEVD